MEDSYGAGEWSVVQGIEVVGTVTYCRDLLICGKDSEIGTWKNAARSKFNGKFARGRLAAQPEGCATETGLAFRDRQFGYEMRRLRPSCYNFPS